MTGILLVDKPEGVSSAGVIRALKPRLCGQKVGHVGTLDPFAGGLLPLCLGEATKVARYLLTERKAYDGVIQLGSATDTLDRTGVVRETLPVPLLSPAVIDAVAEKFTGQQAQVPPMYSAIKRGGVPLYKLARRGMDVAREARWIEVQRLHLIPRGADQLAFTVACSKGTYVRVLAADIGRALGTVAHLSRLRRTRVGAFRLEDATSLEDLVASSPSCVLPLVSVREALRGYAVFAPSIDDLARLRLGQQEALAQLPLPAQGDETALILDSGGRVAAVIEAHGAGWRLVRLLAPS